jgi:predicted nucleic-acid-binding Zn-ribbon protein
MSSIKNPGREPKRANDDSDIGQYSLEGKSVLCPHCNGAQFKAGEAQLNTALATLLNLDWTNKSAIILICASCGQIQWFEKQPLRIT